MEVIDRTSADKRYAKCIEVSKRIRWDFDRDVIPAALALLWSTL